jgi:NADH-quinone oxidoreductase subunit J
MTTRPRLISLDRSLITGLIAVGLFAVMAAIFLSAEFGASAGFPDGVSTITGIGYALLGEVSSAGPEAVYDNSENFLVALILLAVLLDAALDGALMLAKRDDGGDQ